MSKHAQTVVRGALLLMGFGLMGCERGESPRKAVVPVSAAAQDTVRNVSELRQGDTLAVPRITVLKDVRVADRDSVERVVFEFDGVLPEYRVAWGGLPPEQCGSGQAVLMEGDTAVVARFTAAQAHTFEGERARVSVDTRDIQYQGDNIKQLKQLCDFEGVVEWVIGLARRTSFEVHELTGPTRLVVDVRKAQ